MTIKLGRWATLSLLGLGLLAAGTPAWTAEATEASNATDATNATLSHPPELQQQLDALGFQREPLAVYQEQMQIEAVLSPVSEPVSQEANQTSAWLPVELHLQACSDDRCLPPETRVLQIPIEVAP